MGDLPTYSFTVRVTSVYFKKWKLKRTLFFVTEAAKEDIQRNPNRERAGRKGEEAERDGKGTKDGLGQAEICRNPPYRYKKRNEGDAEEEII